MKLVIDAHPAAPITPRPDSFRALCQSLMDILAPQGKAIASCKIDGKSITSEAHADELYAAAALCEVETVAVLEAVQASLMGQVAHTHQLESECEMLVTDILLAEPQDIVEKWRAICELTRQQIAGVPQLAPLMDAGQIDHLVDVRLKEFNSIMEDAAKAFSAADVVTVSDIFEIRFTPWIQEYRKLLESLLGSLEGGAATTSQGKP